jgi:hypothetical protein
MVSMTRSGTCSAAAALPICSTRDRRKRSGRENILSCGGYTIRCELPRANSMRESCGVWIVRIVLSVGRVTDRGSAATDSCL